MPFNILLVDDERDFREEFRECLDEYGVVEASSGEEALEILSRPNEIDLVILDVVMPGMRGTDVLRAMKRMQPDLGVVILTGYGTKSTAIEALKGKADDFVEKPINVEKTKELIARLLRDKATRGEAAAGGVTATIRRVMYFLERNYDKNVSLRDAAAIASLSPKYLSRVFKRSAGIGFNEYKAKVKTRKGAELLASSDYNVDEISAKLGYANPESFARSFKNLTGLAPSAYRIRERRGAGALSGRRPPREIGQSKQRAGK